MKQTPETFYRLNWHTCLLALVMTGVFGTSLAAEPAGNPETSPAITQDTADAILQELKEIRRVLEKIGMVYEKEITKWGQPILIYAVLAEERS